MEIQMHPSVKKIAEYMQAELPVEELSGVAEALATIAPALWGRYPKNPVAALTLDVLPIRPTQHIPEVAI